MGENQNAHNNNNHPLFLALNGLFCLCICWLTERGLLLLRCVQFGSHARTKTNGVRGCANNEVFAARRCHANLSVVDFSARWCEKTRCRWSLVTNTNS